MLVGSLALRALPAVIVLALGFAVASGHIAVRGIHSHALGVSASMRYPDGTQLSVDPSMYSQRGVTTTVHLTSGRADFAVIGGGMRHSRRGRDFYVKGDDVVVIDTPAARIVSARDAGAAFAVTVEPARTIVVCAHCGRGVRAFSRGGVEYVPLDEVPTIIALPPPS